jgi:site-specific DNA-methyltransferase (adenine-specific)
MPCEKGLKHLKDESIDLVVTSPPYDKLRKYKGFGLRTDIIISELFRIIKPGGVVVWVSSDQTELYNESAHSFELVLKFKEEGFTLFDTMIFLKRNPIPKNHRRYEQKFEFMFVFSKGEPKTINLIMIPCKNAGRKRSGNTYIHNGGDLYTAQHKEGFIEDKKIASNVWEYTVGNAERYRNIVKREHPAKFPLLLARDHILSWSNEGDIILDPFIGSGTTAIAALITNRKYIGFEISLEYYKNCLKYIDILNQKILNRDKDVIAFMEEVDTLRYKIFT